jgi:hypothetical protein
VLGDGDVTGCPGRDRSGWTADDIFDVACPSCGTQVEFFKDDGKRDCPSCGRCVVNPRRAQSCAQWCGSAERCSLGRGLATETAPEVARQATGAAPESPTGGARVDG